METLVSVPFGIELLITYYELLIVGFEADLSFKIRNTKFAISNPYSL